MFNNVITELYRKKTVKELIKNMKVNQLDVDDLEQEIYMILLEYNKDKIIDMYNNKQLKFFIVNIINKQYYSKTSPYYKKYKKYYSIVDENVINTMDVIDEYDEE